MPGHADVEHDGVGHRLRDGLDRLGAVLGALHVVAVEREHAAQRVAHGPIVVDHEDPHALDCCAPSADRRRLRATPTMLLRVRARSGGRVGDAKAPAAER